MIELLEVPKHIDTKNTAAEYRTIKYIAEGSYGEVSLVQDINGNQYAMKKIDKEAYSVGDLSKILDEVQHLIILSPHPYICSIRAIFENDKYFYIIQDLCGIELSKKIASADYQQKLKWFHQLVVAIDYCHSRKIIHLDLKPENILVDNDDNIKVIDFGVSQFEERIIHEEVGTLDYLPPEIMSGENIHVSRAADLWALGVICYQLFTGKYPFGITVKDIMRNVSEARYDISMLPPQIIPIVQGLLRADYKERWTTGDILNYLETI